MLHSKRGKGGAVGETKLRKKLALEVAISGVVVFDAIGCYSYSLPVWQFIPMWLGSMLEIEIGAKAVAWLSKSGLGRRLARVSP